jgi:hypothetical protein
MKEHFDAVHGAAQVRCLTNLLDNVKKIFDNAVPNTGFRQQFGLGGIGFTDEKAVQQRIHLFLLGEKPGTGFITQLLSTPPKEIRALIVSQKSGHMRAEKIIGTDESHDAIRDWLMENLYQDCARLMEGVDQPESRVTSSIIAIPGATRENT